MTATFGPAAQDPSERSQLLAISGPIIDVVAHRPVSKSSQNKNSAFIEHRALIDTGASHVCIPPRLAKELDLIAVDFRRIGVVGGYIDATIYALDLEVPTLDYRKSIEVFAPKGRMLNQPILLGRAFLRDFIVTYNGPEGLFHFAKPTTGYNPTHIESDDSDTV